jgi:hypothetical protein
MSKDNEFNPEDLINDAHVQPDEILNEPAINEVKKEESLNEVFKIDAPKTELVRDVNTSAPVLTMKQHYQKMVEGKNFELSYGGKKIYDSKSNVGFQILEDGLMIDSAKYSFSGVTFRIKS